MEKTNHFIRLFVFLMSFGGLGGVAAAQQYRLPMGDCDKSHACYVTSYFSHRGGDWACDDKYYSRHYGTDFGIGGFRQMKKGRTVVAAADGEVIGFTSDCDDDCSFDCDGPIECCKCETGKYGFGNYVEILHPDGKKTRYGHLRKNSVPLSVGIGTQVTCGQMIGQVGSSGCSCGPHLHFEVVNENGVRDDPFSGECGGPRSYWTSQGSYDGLPGKACDPGSRGSAPSSPGGGNGSMVCEAPQLLFPTQNDTNIKLTPLFSWLHVQCGDRVADVYRIQVNTSATFPPECETSETQDVCKWLIAFNGTTSNYETRLFVPEHFLREGTTYFWRVRGGHTSGVGGRWSPVWQFKTAWNSSPNPPGCIPQPEVCDSKDNDCDGMIDENFLNNDLLTRPCSNGCFNGNEWCKVGRWVACDARPCGG